VLADAQMGYKGNSASEEMVKLSETVRNIYNNSVSLIVRPFKISTFSSSSLSEYIDHSPLTLCLPFMALC
jgi:hypothetical protein